jgi:hypothetical protein
MKKGRAGETDRAGIGTCRRPVQMGTSMILAVGGLITAMSCGGQQDDTAEKTSSNAVAGHGIGCAFNKPLPAGYPQRVCQFAPPRIIPTFCLCYPPDAYTNDLLDYQLVTVLHSPPGNMSSISYANGSTLGSVEQITSTSQFGLDVDLTTSTPGGGADVEAKWTEGTVTGSQRMIQTINTNSVGIAVSQDVTSHEYDEFVLWLNPELRGHISGITGKVSATLGPAGTMWSATGQPISSAGPDGKARMQMVTVTGKALANPSARTPAENGFLSRLSQSQIAEILSLDDFYGNDAFDPGADPSQYRYVTTLDLSGPEPGSPITPSTGTTVEYDSQNDPIDGNVNHQEVTVKVGPKFGDDNAISFQAQAGPTWTWDYSDTRTTIQGTQKAANVVLQSSRTCLHAEVDMYLDLAFGSWVPVPRFTNYSCAIDDSDTQCVASDGNTSVQMHCCPTGYAMIGVHTDRNVFKCAPLHDQTGTITLDTGTQRNGMHSCPLGQVMVGSQPELNMLACQTVPSSPVTTERVDFGTQDTFPMHVCESTFISEAMTGIRIDQNLLSCGKNPGVY